MAVITDISAELDALFGTEGSAERTRFDEEAWKFYLDQTKIPRH